MRGQPMSPHPDMGDMTIEELWRGLTQYDKEYLLVFPAFNNKQSAIRWLRKNDLIPPKTDKVPEMAWSRGRRTNNPYFKQFEYLRPNEHHDDVIALYKKDKEMLLWAKAGADVDESKGKDKDTLSTLRKFGGKITVNEMPISEEDEIDWTEVGNMPSPSVNGSPNKIGKEAV